MAAPVGVGREAELRIRRFFTTEGVHPYDEIEWDVRDAVIQNYRTGEVAFEQRGVEVPKAWTQNATNIAAQKYFRGSLGTPERERSVKQMIDRVVSRYHEEGVERGYFADEGEAAIFRDELTHLLVTQKAAFNSPVWFNVGWRPKGEEQVSACQPYHALVSTPGGLVPIGKLVEEGAVGTKVYSAHGPTRVVATKANGVKDVLRIHTKAGYTLDVTADHLVWKRVGEGRGMFVEAGGLRPGDAVEWHRVYAYGEAELDPRDVAEAAVAAGIPWHVPEHLFAAPLPVVAAFLKATFDTAGSPSIRGRSAAVVLETRSEELVRGVQRLLLRFGIFCRLALEGGRWSLRIEDKGDRAAFAAEIGFVDAGKRAHLEESLELPGLASGDTKALEIAHVEALGPMEVYDIQTENGEYLSDNLRVHNCFILSVEDEMDSILNWYAEEGRIFKHGSGAGINLSPIRSSKERLRSGGTASGPVSFMRGADASAGTIKSGGATRRAAKMVVLNVGHPDIRDFIWCKALEENKARALRDAGFDMDLDGKDSHSIQYQNANNSVRVDDAFMNAVLNDDYYELKAVTTGETFERVKARELMREIADAAWQCADPGLQYDTTINDWHTCPNSGRINASNPCFTGDTRVHTDKGLVRFDDIMGRVMDGESFEVYTHDVTNPDEPRETITLSKPTQFMVTGVNEVVRLRFSDGREVRCTPNHRFWTENRGWVRADELTEEDELRMLEEPTPATLADYSLPVSTHRRAYAIKGTRSRELELSEKWDEELAYYIGWLIGDGCISGKMLTTIYGSEEDRDEVLPRHMKLVKRLNGGVEPKPSVQENGTVQLRLCRGPLIRFFEALGVKRGKAADKEVPWSIFEAPDDIVAAFLRGLFDADGCVYDGATRYAGLGSKSIELLKGVQVLLARLGIPARVYDVTGGKGDRTFTYTRKKTGETVTYESTGNSYDLRVPPAVLGRFFGVVGFDLERKLYKLEEMINKYETHTARLNARLADRSFDGFELTYNLTEPLNHSYIVNGLICSNCSEFLHVDNSSCNLASLNLLKFLDENEDFDVEAFKHAVEVVFLAQEISVGFASYPTEKIAENSHRMRQLGQGYANLGALLMSQGLPYDSDEGRAWAAAITALMTGHCYATSAKIATRVGRFDAYAENEQPMLRVIGKHRDAAYEIPDEHTPASLLSAARSAWDEALALGTEHGYRNAQATVLAPTGTIGLLMDCDTTGIEPDLALKKTKKLVGGGTMSIVNQSVPRALRKLGYGESQIGDIVAYIDEHSHVIGAPHLAEEHLPVFDTAMGERSIHYSGHIKMMAAAQPFLSGAISKTVNLPEHVTVEDVEQVYIEGWRLGLKAIAIYRDNCKAAQPLSVTKKEKAEAAKATDLPEPVRRRLPKKRVSKTIKFRVADTEGYVTVGEFPDGTVGEMFLKVAKQGSTLAGIMDAFAISISMGLQYGVPLSAYVKQFVNTRFEPSGLTDDPDFRIATSILDYVFRVLAYEYLPVEERHALGIRSSGERQDDIEAKLANAAAEHGNGNGHTEPEPPSPDGVVVLGPVADATQGSRPFCGTCGVQMQPAGSCFACPSCGSTSGCS